MSRLLFRRLGFPGELFGGVELTVVNDELVRCDQLIRIRIVAKIEVAVRFAEVGCFQAGLQVDFLLLTCFDNAQLIGALVLVLDGRCVCRDGRSSEQCRCEQYGCRFHWHFSKVEIGPTAHFVLLCEGPTAGLYDLDIDVWQTIFFAPLDRNFRFKCAGCATGWKAQRRRQSLLDFLGDFFFARLGLFASGGIVAGSPTATGVGFDVLRFIVAGLLHLEPINRSARCRWVIFAYLTNEIYRIIKSKKLNFERVIGWTSIWHVRS